MEPKTMRELAEALDSGKKFTVGFECGGDETLVDFHLDGKQLDWQNPICEELFQILYDQFELPNAGEWFLKGDGTFSKEGDKLHMTFAWTTSGLDWNPDTDEETWIEEEKLTGKEVVYDFEDD